MKTPITYYGGKQMMVSRILPLIPKHRMYVEPFCGGAAVFWSKPRSEQEVINDLHQNLITFYEVMKTDFDALNTKVQATLHSRHQFNVARAILQNPSDHTLIDRAWAFWVCAQQSYIGMVGASWGYDLHSVMPRRLKNMRDRFVEYARRLEYATIECDDALTVINRYDSPDTFFYIDPPYYNSDCDKRTGWDEYTLEDYTNLLDSLSSIQGMFLLSSYPSEILAEYIQRNTWDSTEYHMPKCVHKGDVKQEMLVANYLLGGLGLEGTL